MNALRDQYSGKGNDGKIQALHKIDGPCGHYMDNFNVSILFLKWVSDTTEHIFCLHSLQKARLLGVINLLFGLWKMSLPYPLHTDTIVLCYIYPGTSISIRWCSLPPGNELYAPNVTFNFYILFHKFHVDLSSNMCNAMICFRHVHYVHYIVSYIFHVNLQVWYYICRNITS